MLQNLMIATIVVAILWVIILVLYVTVSRRQPDVAAQLKALEDQLEQAEAEAEQK